MMEGKIIDATDLESFVTQVSREVPTGRVIHDEIGVSWEIIANKVYFCSRNDVQKYADLLPRAYYTGEWDSAVQTVLSIWDDAVKAYKMSIVNQEGRVSGVEEKWKKERSKYERALTFIARFFRLSKDELAAIRTQTDSMDYIPGYNGEYDPLDVAYDEIARKNKKILLERMKPVLKQLPIEQAQKLAAFYSGYTALAYIPLVACIHIMSEDAKRALKEQIDNATATAKEQLQRTPRHTKELADCYGILQGDNAKLRGDWKSIWDNLEEKVNGSLYLHALRMASLVLLYPAWGLKDFELEMLMEYTLFLNDTQRRQIMDRAKGLLSDGNVQTPHTLEEIKPFVQEVREEEILEGHFGLAVASEVYDMYM